LEIVIAGGCLPIGVYASLARALHAKTFVRESIFWSVGAITMGKKKGAQKGPISAGLRQTIRERRLTAYATAKRAGVSVDAVQRFLNAERGLTLATADKLADALALTLCPDEAT
jgi:hypothetical protein